MEEMQAKNWRREQRVIDHGPDLLVSQEQFDANRQARKIQETQIMQAITYHSKGHYTRNARNARDGKGNVRGQGVQENKHYASRRLIASVCATLVIFSAGISYAHSQSQNIAPSQTSTTMVEMAGIEAEELGLTPELVQKLKDYEAFFEYFDPSQEISEEVVLAKIAEINQLKDEVLSQKLGSLFGVPYYEVEPGELYFDNKSGDAGASIQVGKDILLGTPALPIFKKNDISKDITAYLEGFSRIDELANKVRDDRISKSAAIKRLGDIYFERIEIMANAEFSKDEHNNIKISYEQEKEVNRAVKNGTLKREESEDFER